MGVDVASFVYGRSGSRLNQPRTIVDHGEMVRYMASLTLTQIASRLANDYADPRDLAGDLFRN